MKEQLPSDEILFRTVVTAGLLHDIGKFLQRGDWPVKAIGQHPEISRQFILRYQDFFAQYCDAELLVELVAHHHEGPAFKDQKLRVSDVPQNIRRYALMVSRADNYSSSERDEKHAASFKTTPLASIFSRLQLEQEKPAQQSYRLAELTPETAFPTAETGIVSGAVYHKHGKAFGDQFVKFINSRPADFDQFFTGLLALLQKYTWCVPSSTWDALPDISLFDHLKTTATIAAALFRYHEQHPKAVSSGKKEKFRLVVGDLSGIQHYIFRLTNKGEGNQDAGAEGQNSGPDEGSRSGIAKRLRARSFYLGIISDVVSHMLLQACGMPLCNLLMTAGGKFYVLLPELDGIEAIIGGIQQRVDNELLARFHGELALNMASVRVSGKEFADFAEVFHRAGQALAARKRKAFSGVLQINGGWRTEAFVGGADQILDDCPACGKVHQEHGLCRDCRQDFAMGKALLKQRIFPSLRDKLLRAHLELSAVSMRLHWIGGL